MLLGTALFSVGLALSYPYLCASLPCSFTSGVLR
jgi:hypothetical protein